MGVRKASDKDEKFKFSEGFIQVALNRFFAPNSVKYNIDNLYIFDWESDKLLETRSGYIYEFEVKISRADFKNDFKHKKDKHIILEGEEKYGDKYLPKYYDLLKINESYGDWAVRSFHKNNDENPYYLIGKRKRPNYFYYAVPTDLISVEDVPEYAGLIYVDENKNLTIKKKAPQLHKDKYKDSELNLGEKFYYNMVKWKDECGRAWKESNAWREKFKTEVDSKGNSMGYKEMEAMVESYRKSNEELDKWYKQSNSQLHKDLYRQNRMVALLARELQKYNQEFNLFAFEEEHFGKE